MARKNYYQGSKETVNPNASLPLSRPFIYHAQPLRSLQFLHPQSSPPPPPAVYSLRLLSLRILPWPAGPDAALTPYQVATEIPYSLNWSMAFLSATHLLVVS